MSLLLLAVLSLANAQYKQAKKFHINLDEDDRDNDSSAATLQQYRARQAQSQSPSQYEYSSEEEDENVPAAQTYHRPASNAKQFVVSQPNYQQPRAGTKFNSNIKKQQQQQFEEELEEEEPDRLAILMEKSQFKCEGRTAGYYADDTIGCEVFHYCQDNSKHSWVCPEGFTFHQVHLICMPPSNENICEQSQKYHFVNDYLYKPINMEEHQSKPNVSLR